MRAYAITRFCLNTHIWKTCHFRQDLHSHEGSSFERGGSLRSAFLLCSSRPCSAVLKMYTVRKNSRNPFLS
uniref:Uncharacterized protein n=1 Tax=Anguilla anguilla TaxID=7936 RepID=A0A0E9X6I5_ANGAN